jgi:hypothetical protein
MGIYTSNCVIFIELFIEMFIDIIIQQLIVWVRIANYR